MPESLTVMTWNVENLFPVGWQVSPRKKVAQADFDAKLDFLADAINQISPDVAALQELGGGETDVATTLAALNARLGLAYPHHAPSRHPDSRQIRVAFFSRLPLSGITHIIDFAAGELATVPGWHGAPTTRLGRGALLATIRVGNHTIDLLTAHLKSKLITYQPHPNQSSRFRPDNEAERAIGAGLALLRRTAEAVAIRICVSDRLQIPQPHHMIVLGDLNDEVYAATSQLILGPEDKDATSQDALDPVRLYNLAAGIPRRGGMENDLRFLDPKENYTRIYQDRGELIDHIIVSRSLLGPGSELTHGRSFVKEVRSRVDLIKGQSIGDDPTERIGEPAPDHAPVYARFKLP
ncbi:MAG: endonuclease/exonuclease/phosphatase family protein [Anaerolinea sp.]|nr:endonuclease/exonuclease/phosphatase family protein [Anaerolinea sp.]